MKSFLPALILVAFLSGNAGNAQTASVTANQPALPAPTAWASVSSGANSRVWERTVYEPGPNGTVVPKKHHYTELSTGLNFWQNGQWQPSREEIDLLPPGSAYAAAAVNGQHQAWFPLDIDQGVIQLSTPDGKQLQSRPVGLFFEDDNNSVLIAVLTNSVGELVGSNVVVYPNAFEGATASLRYRYTRAGFEQDVIVQGQLPDPAASGLDPARTRLGVLTAFFGTNNPVATPGPTDPQTGLSDVTLAFGKMKMVQGRAFVIGDTNRSRLTPAATGGTRTYKSWLNLNGHKFLLEEVPYSRVAPQLEQLPVTGRAETIATNLFAANSILNRVSARRDLSPAQGMKSAMGNQAPKMTRRLTQAEGNRTRGLVLDYVELNSDTNNYTFQGDTTYYVSGEYNLSGTTTFEGGTVIKLNNAGQIDIDSAGKIVCSTGPYRPAIFTSLNDDSVGEPLDISSGTPAMGDVNTFLNLNCPNAILSNMRFNYANDAINQYGNLDLWNCQFVPVDAVVTFAGNVGLHNVLIQEVWLDTPIQVDYAYAENVTLDGDGGLGVDAQTNCIEVEGEAGENAGVAFMPSGNVYVSVNGGTPEYSAASIFQTVGAANFYLATNSPYRNAGTTNIDPALLADLAAKTTYPPIVYSNATISVPTTFSPQAQRDNLGNPDLGYHYDPIDYFFGGVTANSNLTFTAGTAMGWFPLPGSSWQATGISLVNDAIATLNGTVTAPCVATYWANVQEGNGLWENYGGLGAFSGGGTYDPANPGQLIARCAHFSVLAGYQNFRDGPSGQPILFHATDCELYGGGGGYNPQLAFTNCLFYRGGVGQATGDSQYSWETYREIYRNCTFYGGQLDWTHWESPPYWRVSVRDCSFDQGVAFNISAPNNSWLDDGYNAYLTNSAQLPASVGSDVIVTNFNWQSSWFGNFYLPPDSLLIDAGDRTADTVGLYHFTTQTNQLPETNSVVDIGYHYVATDQYGNPLDSNGNGIPDYLEDANGNGIYDAGDLGDWQSFLNIKVLITQPSSGSPLP